MLKVSSVALLTSKALESNLATPGTRTAACDSEPFRIVSASLFEVGTSKTEFTRRGVEWGLVGASIRQSYAQ